MYRLLLFALLLTLLVIPTMTEAEQNTTDPLRQTIFQRLSNIEIRQTVMGCLIFLDDWQVRDRSGRRKSIYDASDEGEGCKGKVNVNLPFLKTLHVPALAPITVKNLRGEWTSDVHFIPKKLGRKGNTIVAVPDSNLFVPSFVIYPFFLLREDNSLAADDRFITNMLKEAWHLDTHYKRGNAYNFWLPSKENPAYSGPYNMPIEKAVLPLARAYLNPRLTKFWKLFAGKLNVPTPDWVKRCLDPVDNPSGAAALFNIPNDADDTSTAIAIQTIRQQLRNSQKDDTFLSNENNFQVDYPALTEILKWRDVNRDPKLEDGRDAWKGKNSGAFLTWLKDEKKQTFSEAERGVIPLGKNNVDAVVNANVLLALGVTGKKDSKGYQEAITLLDRAIKERVWPACGLYYPQFMIFPYTASRAYRDGGNEGLKPAMAILLKDLLKIQNEYAIKYPKHAGAFPGGEDRMDHVSTALGVTTLLNIGADVAQEAGVQSQYDKAIRGGIGYLLKTRKKWKIQNKETFNKLKKNRHIHGYCWESGLFFAASFWDLAHWRSVPFTTAMVLEAFTKYLLAYDKGGVSIMEGRRLHIMQYPSSMEKDDMDARLTVY
jgi:hypothetical protein